jgi:hypothetical protein
MTRHNSGFVAASHPIPGPAFESRHFYCSCSIDYTAAHAFHAHCRRTGHVGSWLRSKYESKGHGSTIAGAILPSTSHELIPVAEHAVSNEDSPELSKLYELLLNAGPFISDDSGLGPPIDSEEADAIDEADIPAILLTKENHDSSDDGHDDVNIDHTQVIPSDSITASPLEARATSIVESTSLTETIIGTNRSDVSSRVDKDNPTSTRNVYIGS